MEMLKVENTSFTAISLSCRNYYLYLCSDVLQKIILLHSNKLHPLSAAEQAGENLQSINISKIKILFTESIQGEKELIVEVTEVLWIQTLSQNTSFRFVWLKNFFGFISNNKSWYGFRLFLCF